MAKRGKRKAQKCCLPHLGDQAETGPQASPAGPPVSWLYKARPKDFGERPQPSRDCCHMTFDSQPQAEASSSPKKEVGLPPHPLPGQGKTV